MTGDSFYDDADRLDYPAAQRLVVEYLRERQERTRTTSVDVLDASDYPNDHHNRERVYTALSRFCTETDDNWAGRTIFIPPEEVPEL